MLKSTNKNSLLSFNFHLFCGLLLAAFLFQSCSNNESDLSQAEAKVIQDGDINKQDTVYKIVDEQPMFPGCSIKTETYEERRQCANDKLLEFIYSNLEYPEDAREESAEGMAVVKYIVDKNGNVRDLEILRSVHSSCDQSILNVFEQMKKEKIKWIPAVLNGEAVDAEMVLPVKFKLEG